MPQEDLHRMQEEAMRRVRDMQNRARRHTEPEREEPTSQKEEPLSQGDAPSPPPAGGLETLLKEKDRALILTLLLLLSEDEGDPGLIFSLLFLLL